MRIQVFGATAVATELLTAARGIEERVQKVSMESARDIVDDWKQEIPRRTGMTASDRNNFAEPMDAPGTAGAAAVSDFFVAYFLQTGTANMGPKMDLFGSAEDHIDKWQGALADEVGL